MYMIDGDGSPRFMDRETATEIAQKSGFPLRNPKALTTIDLWWKYMNNVQVFINHESDIISRAKRALSMLKGFEGGNSQTSKKIDACSDEICKIIGACETFKNIFENSDNRNIDEE